MCWTPTGFSLALNPSRVSTTLDFKMEIIKADKDYKNKCLKLIVLWCAIGLFLVKYSLEFIANMPLTEESLDFSLNLLTLIFLSLIPWGLYICIFAKRIYKTGQFPPLGQKVLRDTRVYRGKVAHQRAFICLILGVFLIVASLIVSIYFPAKFREIKQKSNQQIKRMENGWVLPEKQNQIAVVGRAFASPPLIANR